MSLASFSASSLAAVSTWVEPALVCCDASVTPWMSLATSLVPAAACRPGDVD
nr:hypothetical protein [uncultured Dongia sp.]